MMAATNANWPRPDTLRINPAWKSITQRLLLVAILLRMVVVENVQSTKKGTS